MKKVNTLTLIGLAATGLEIIATLISNQVSEKKLVKTVEEKVAEAFADRMK